MVTAASDAFPTLVREAKRFFGAWAKEARIVRGRLNGKTSAEKTASLLEAQLYPIIVDESDRRAGRFAAHACEDRAAVIGAIERAAEEVSCLEGLDEAARTGLKGAIFCAFWW